MSRELDLSQTSLYDMICDRDRSLNVSITATYFDLGVEQPFDFTPYSGATLVVKNAQGTILITFDMSDGSIELLPNGIFKLVKTAEEMNAVRAGIYNYDMYLSSGLYPKRGFLKGQITFNQNIAN